MDEEALAALVRQLLKERRLPRAPASTILASYGDGTSCAVCAQGIRAHDVMYELRYGSGPTAEALSMHLRCFLSWESALAKP